ncbi:MAG: hypothetical protein NTZ33_00280 [Bacteroidetes bacterium]|nr:hypothetical protein [Bacteroidota bacterium]
MKKLLFSTLLLLVVYSVNAQKDIVQFLAAGKKDANIMANYYAKPFLNTFGNNLNNGWYSTAAPLKTGRFTVTIGATGSMVPADEQSFKIIPKEYSVISTTGNVPVTASTMFGEKTSPTGVFAKYNDGASSILFPLNIPEGSGFNISPLPLVQFSLGLFKGTEVMLRGFPKFHFTNEGITYKAGYIGIGVKHDIKQWIPFMKELPFDLSVIGAFTSASFDVQAKDKFLLDPEVNVPNPDKKDYSTQELNFSTSAWNLNLIISKKLSLLTVFGGFRFSHSKTTLDLLGYYPVTTLSNPSIATSKIISHIQDPFSLNGSSSQFGLNAGVRIKLGIFAIFAEGSFAPGGYSSVSGGLNFGLFN